MEKKENKKAVSAAITADFVQNQLTSLTLPSCSTPDTIPGYKTENVMPPPHATLVAFGSLHLKSEQKCSSEVSVRQADGRQASNIRTQAQKECVSEAGM